MISVAENTMMLSTGKKFYAYGGVVSLDEKGNLLYGWDGEVCGVDGVMHTFTGAERTEIADAMITRWEGWKNPHPKREI